ncbi:kelch-like protein diablo isoform X3 [Spodoptera litura]|uniref:Kelch-like protein diablo isoform X3 n=1 Tax=Spodoptera litura TaxID=69820 RepID=A0A9J7IMN1_SPOLT|nr:kelch-like protein diablo isoform X3 [Spodoptera litura]
MLPFGLSVRPDAILFEARNMKMGEGGSPGGAGGGGARLSHTSEKHPRAILGELSALRRHRELCDVVLNVANRKLFAHRVILSACSPYFRAMFTGELAESRATEVTIRDVDEQAMEQLVEFCYTAHIVVEESNVQALLPAACLLQLQEIQDVCCEFLKRQLDCSNCLGIRAFADTHSCRELLRIADKFTQQNFPEVMESEEFLLLPAAQLIDIVSSDELNVRSEEQTFQAVMSWVKYNVAERRQHLAQVLQHVRLPLLSPKFLVGTVSSELLIRSDDACRDLLDEAKNYLLLPQERPLMQGPRTRPRKPTRRVMYRIDPERSVAGLCRGSVVRGGRVVLGRRHRVRGAVRPADVGVEDGGAHVQAALRRRRGRAARAALRRGRPRRTELPQQHRALRPADQPVVRQRGAHVVVPHVRRRGRAGRRALRRRRPGRRAVPQPRRAVRPQGEPLDQGGGHDDAAAGRGGGGAGRPAVRGGRVGRAGPAELGGALLPARQQVDGRGAHVHAPQAPRLRGLRRTDLRRRRPRRLHRALLRREVRAAHRHVVAGGGDDVTSQRRGAGRRQRTALRRRGIRRHRLPQVY